MYAGLSITSPTAWDGALRLERFVEEANARGLEMPGAGS
jgi:hypothetical protein